MIDYVFLSSLAASICGFLFFFLVTREAKRLGGMFLSHYSRFLFFAWILILGEVLGIYLKLQLDNGILSIIFSVSCFLGYLVALQGLIIYAYRMLKCVFPELRAFFNKYIAIAISAFYWIMFGLMFFGENPILSGIADWFLSVAACYCVAVLLIAQRSQIGREPLFGVFFKSLVFSLPALIAEPLAVRLSPEIGEIFGPFAVGAIFFYLLWNIASLRFLLRKSSCSPPCRQSWNLTQREEEVLKQIVAGKSNKEAGFALSISEKTVKNHLTSIFQKSGVQSRLELVRGVMLQQREAEKD